MLKHLPKKTQIITIVPLVGAITIFAQSSGSTAPILAPELPAETFEDLMDRAEQQRKAGDYAGSARSYTDAYRSLSENERAGLRGEVAFENALTDYQIAYGQRTFDELILRAERQRSTQNYEASARTYASAYRSLPKEERIGLRGEIAFDNALENYKRAHRQSPENIVALEEAISLIEDYIEELSSQDANQATVVSPELERTQKQLSAALTRARRGFIPPSAPEPDPVDRAADQEQSPKRHLVWGSYRPLPTWKKVGLGISGGLLFATGTATIGMTIWLNSEGPRRSQRVQDAAEQSLLDGNSLNDIDPSDGGDLCDLAAERPVDPITGAPAGQPGQIRNASVYQACQGSDVREIRIVTGIATGISAALTATFTTLLFVHLAPTQPSRTWKLTLSPAQEGVTLRVGGRF